MLPSNLQKRQTIRDTQTAIESMSPGDVRVFEYPDRTTANAVAAAIWGRNRVYKSDYVSVMQEGNRLTLAKVGKPGPSAWQRCLRNAEKL